MWEALEIILGEKPDINKVEIQDDSNGKGAYISKWGYDVPEPTIEQLKALSEIVEQINALDARIEKVRELRAGLNDRDVEYDRWRRLLIKTEKGYLSEREAIINEQSRQY